MHYDFDNYIDNVLHNLPILSQVHFVKTKLTIGIFKKLNFLHINLLIIDRFTLKTKL